MNKKQKLKFQIQQKEMQLKKLHLHQGTDDVCCSLINSLTLEKAVLKKELEQLEQNRVIEFIKGFTQRKEKRICDYFKA